jgi:pantoate--beta-alanine ligase
MLAVETIQDLRAAVLNFRRAGKKIGFVPTMGALHRGHLSLVEKAREQADVVVMSIFVNPTQFNSPDDLKKYPRPIERDIDQAASVGVDLLFFPKEQEIYPSLYDERGRLNPRCFIKAGASSLVLEGPHRPGHFDGVTTVVGLLFNLVQPDSAVFGEKDFQQLRVIEEMVHDLRFPVKIIGAPLIRDNDGLALSSRNERLSVDERRQALVISQALFWAQEAVRKERNAKILEANVRQRIESGGLKVDYVTIVDRRSLQALEKVEHSGQLLAAAYVGQVRLTDNVALSIS